jgi:hypothetical protein
VLLYDLQLSAFIPSLCANLAAKAPAHHPQPRLEAKPAIRLSAYAGFGVVHRHLQMAEAFRGVSKRMGVEDALTSWSRRYCSHLKVVSYVHVVQKWR